MNVIIRNNFVEYFGNPIMKKIKVTKEGAAVYVAQVKSLSFEHKYVIAIGRNDSFPMEYQVPLSTLKWDVIQTKALNTNYDVLQFHYNPNKDLSFFKQKVKRTAPETFYNDIYNLTVGIKKTMFKDEISLSMAIEQYDTTIILDIDNE